MDHGDRQLLAGRLLQVDGDTSGLAPPRGDQPRTHPHPARPGPAAANERERAWAPHCLPDPTLTARLLALQRALGEPVVACRATAANLHGFGVLTDPILHVTTVSGDPGVPIPGVRLHRLAPRLPLVERGRVWAVHPAETTIEVARGAAPIDVLAVLDAARRSGVTAESLASALELAGPAPGVAEIGRLLEHADPRADSAMESRTRFRVLEAGLPKPDLQIIVAISKGVFRRLDLGWRRRRVGLEYDGPGCGAEDGMLARDRLRHRQLRSAGWTVLYATAADIVDNPGPLIRQLHQLLI